MEWYHVWPPVAIVLGWVIRIEWLLAGMHNDVKWIKMFLNGEIKGGDKHGNSKT